MVAPVVQMELHLTVVRYAGEPPAKPLSIVFDQHGGSIGRRDSNDWALPDPERFISGRHALVSFAEERFYLTDTSVNGVFLNHSAIPVGRENRVALEDGDTLTIGDYEIGVSVQQPVNPARLEQNEFEDPFAKVMQDSVDKDLDQGFADQPAPVLPSEEPAPSLDLGLELEPGTPLSPELGEPVGPPGNARPAESNHVPDLNEFFNQPMAIPEDWDETTGMGSAPLAGAAPASPPAPSDQEPADDKPMPLDWSAGTTSPPQPYPAAAPIQPAPIQPAPSIPPQQPVPSARPAQDDGILRTALVRGLQLEPGALGDTPLVEILENLGQVVRFSVEGTMATLRARAEMKGEFRMSQTMIAPVENNPLKFSINIDEALRHIVNPQPGKGYLSPRKAISEANEDIEAHMLAVMVGMQGALTAVLQRFKPDVLEQRLGQSALLGNLPLYKNAKTWDLFRELYSEIADEAEDDFQVLFGKAFAEAYEEQIRRLESLKQETTNQPGPGSS